MLEYLKYITFRRRVKNFVVLVGLVLIFKDKIEDIVDDIFNKITTKTNKF